jgi:hypothetical protein
MLYCSVAMGQGAPATPPASPPRLFDLVIETGMPHLDENLRYATTRDRRCLDPRDLSGAFPVLRHVSLQDCRLVKTDQQRASAAYVLQCTGGHGTTGTAHWQFDEGAIAGTLDVKLGGKNMTFHQRISGRDAGPCPSAAPGD